MHKLARVGVIVAALCLIGAAVSCSLLEKASAGDWIGPGLLAAAAALFFGSFFALGPSKNCAERCTGPVIPSWVKKKDIDGWPDFRRHLS